MVETMGTSERGGSGSSRPKMTLSTLWAIVTCHRATPDVLARVRSCLEDDDPRVREAAAEAERHLAEVVRSPVPIR